MTRDELFDMAEKAGLGFIRHASDKDVNKFEQLAALVASAEREACAKLCEEQMQGKSIWIEGARACSLAIRAKGQA